MKQFLTLSADIYSKESVLLSVQRFNHKYSIILDILNGSYEFSILNSDLYTESEILDLTDLLCKSIIDFESRNELEKQFGNLRKIIYNRAFGDIID